MTPSPPSCFCNSNQVVAIFHFYCRPFYSLAGIPILWFHYRPNDLILFKIELFLSNLSFPDSHSRPSIRVSIFCTCRFLGQMPWYFVRPSGKSKDVNKYFEINMVFKSPVCHEYDASLMYITFLNHLCYLFFKVIFYMCILYLCIDKL